MRTRHAVGLFILLAASALVGCQQGQTWADGAFDNRYSRCVDTERCSDSRVDCQCRSAAYDTRSSSRQTRYVSTLGEGNACEAARPNSRGHSHTLQSHGHSRQSRDRREPAAPTPQTRPQPKPTLASTPAKPVAPRKQPFGKREDEKPPAKLTRDTWLQRGRGGAR